MGNRDSSVIPFSAILLSRAVKVYDSASIQDIIIENEIFHNGYWCCYKWSKNNNTCKIENLDAPPGKKRQFHHYSDDKTFFRYRINNLELFSFQREYLLMGYKRCFSGVGFSIITESENIKADEAVLSLFKLDDIPLIIVTLSISFSNTKIDELILARRSLYRDDVLTELTIGSSEKTTNFRYLCDRLDKSKLEESPLSDIETTFSATELLLPEVETMTLTVAEKYGLLRCDEGYYERPAKKIAKFLKEHHLPEETGIQWYADDLHLLVLNTKRANIGVKNPIPVDTISSVSRTPILPLFCHNLSETITYYKGTLELILTHSASLLKNDSDQSVVNLAKIQKEISFIKRKSMPLLMRESDIFPIILSRPRIKELVQKVNILLTDAKESVERESAVRSLFVAHLLNAIFCFGALVGVENFLIPKWEAPYRVIGVLVAALVSVLLFIFLRRRNG